MFTLRTLLIAVAVFLVPGAAHAANWSLCMKYSAQLNDTNLGEDYNTAANAAWPAIGAKVRVFSNGAWGPFQTTDLVTGCFPFTAPTATAVIIELHAEHTLANGQKVYVRNDYAGTKALKVWAFTAALSLPGNTVNFYTPNSPESNLAAVVPTAVQRISLLTGNVPSAAGKFVNVYPQDCSVYMGMMACTGSAYIRPADSLFINPTLDHDHRKFLVGHEVGHFLERWWGNGVNINTATYLPNDDPDADCDFDGLGNHGMRSREKDTAAYKEGIAHFISAATWNSVAQQDGVFKYYKTDAPYNEELIQLNVPGMWAFNWEGTVCGQPRLAERSVEGDWMRFFWNYITDPADPVKPTMQDLASHIFELYTEPGLTGVNAYPRLLDTLTAANQMAFTTRFTNRATTHGVVDP